MPRKKYNLKLAVLKRWLRTAVPQLVLLVPLLIKYAEPLKEVLPLWVIPVFVFVGSTATAADKLFRELHK